jgi:hypothetical protein
VLSLTVDIFFASVHRHATFADEIRAREWIRDTVVQLYLEPGFNGHERMEIVTCVQMLRTQ